MRRNSNDRLLKIRSTIYSDAKRVEDLCWLMDAASANELSLQSDNVQLCEAL